MVFCVDSVVFLHGCGRRLAGNESMALHSYAIGAKQGCPVSWLRFESFPRAFDHRHSIEE